MKIRNTRIVINKGDITECDADAIVNPAHDTLSMSGGISGIIKEKGGSCIEAEAIKKGPLPPGGAVATGGGGLRVKKIIHAVTMTGDKKTSEDIIRNSCRNALLIAKELKMHTIVFPALGCGRAGFPPRASAKIMAQEILKHLQGNDSSLEEIRFCLFDDKTYDDFNGCVFGYLDYILNKLKCPFVTVDAIIETAQGLVLIQRSNPPFGFALPGGFVDYGESLEDAVIREVKEETGLDLVDLRQFHTYSDPRRDPRFHTITIVYSGRAEGVPRAGDDAAAVKVAKLEEIEGFDFAFNHKEIIRDYISSKQTDI